MNTITHYINLETIEQVAAAEIKAKEGIYDDQTAIVEGLIALELARIQLSTFKATERLIKLYGPEWCKFGKDSNDVYQILAGLGYKISRINLTDFVTRFTLLLNDDVLGFVDLAVKHV